MEGHHQGHSGKGTTKATAGRTSPRRPQQEGYHHEGHSGKGITNHHQNRHHREDTSQLWSGVEEWSSDGNSELCGEVSERTEE
ncbi:hypothetical protein Pcinc_022651 [Petrolisthes cinctipes]|uniref:Uncharacterized protein n=1 Tax=Petrolisthes cinctipes TaxID=88211 RepID=A0AAE1KGU2_PETCI|nr:hypothetical protein Pcinc_022651 [Petrolisthes cinctipes]